MKNVSRKKLGLRNSFTPQKNQAQVFRNQAMEKEFLYCQKIWK